MAGESVTAPLECAASASSPPQPPLVQSHSRGPAVVPSPPGSCHGPQPLRVRPITPLTTPPSALPCELAEWLPESKAKNRSFLKYEISPRLS